MLAELTYQAQQPVSIEDEVGLLGMLVPDEGVHSSDLEIRGDDFQIVVDAAEVMLLQLHADVLCDEIDRDYVGLLPARLHARQCLQVPSVRTEAD